MPAVTGKDAIVELWVNAMAGFPFVAQLIQNGTTEINGDTATGRWYIVEHIQTTEKTPMVILLGFLILVFIKINTSKKTVNGFLN
jgi:hypothetical protein